MRLLFQLLALSFFLAILAMWVAVILAGASVPPVHHVVTQCLHGSVLLTITGTSYREIIKKAQEALDTERCMRGASRVGLDPYNSVTTQSSCFRRQFRDHGRKR